MGLPIAIGSKSVSSYPVSTPLPIEEYSDLNDGTILVPVVQPRGGSPASQTTIFSAETTNGRGYNSHQLQALVMVSYHDMLRLDNGDCEHTIAEIRIQISMTAEPFSTIHNKETVHRIRLPCTSEIYRDQLVLNGKIDDNYDSEGVEQQTDNIVASPPKAHAIFSSDSRFLTCLIPHPSFSNFKTIGHHTTVVIFQLRNPIQPTLNRQSFLPPVPSYVQESTNKASVPSPNASTNGSKANVPVASNPKILCQLPQSPDYRHLKKKAILGVRSICDVTTNTMSVAVASESYRSFLLLGFDDGSIRAVSYRRMIMTDALANDNLVTNSDNQQHKKRWDILGMDHISEWTIDETLQGHLAVVYGDGMVGIFRTEIRFDKVSTHNGVDTSFTHLDENRVDQGSILISLAKTHLIDQGTLDSSNTSKKIIDGSPELRFRTAKWICDSYLAVAVTSTKASIDSMVHVFALYGTGKFASISSIQLSSNHLNDTSNASYVLNNLAKTSYLSTNWNKQEHVTNVHRSEPLIWLQYDSASDCLTISGCYDSSQSKAEQFGFAVAWNWRANVQGLTIVPSSYDERNRIIDSRFIIAADEYKNKKMAHILFWETTSGTLHIRKELYEIGILSPSNSILPNAAAHHDSTLLMLPSSVCYPVVTKSIANYEIEWCEYVIPRSYLSTCGSPIMSSIGPKFGRSVAIAATKGFCILECDDRYHVEAVLSSGRQGLSIQGKLALLGKRLKWPMSGPRWIQFGNAADERNFRVVAMTWWESLYSHPKGLEPIQWDDVLVTVIELTEGDQNGFHLACWSYRNLSLDGQLLKLSSLSSSCWGLSLPMGFEPRSIDIIACPDRHLQTRKAVVLLTGTDYETKLLVYNLQLVQFRPDGENGLRDRKLYSVVGALASEASIGSPADLFLATASFAFRLDEDERLCSEKTFYVATIGVIRKNGGGLDAVAVSTNHVVAIGQVIPSVDLQRSNCQQAEISRLWLSDIISRRRFSPDGSLLDMFVWTVQRRDGSLAFWSVPIVSRKSDFYILTASVSGLCSTQFSVHAKLFILGVHGNAGSMNTWMLQSSSGTRLDCLVGSVPRSNFGYILGIGQHSKRFHRTPNDVDANVFRPRCFDHEVFSPGDFTLYPAASLTSIFSSLSDLASSEDHHRGIVISFDYGMRRRLARSLLRQATTLSLRLLILRSLDKVSSLRAKHKIDTSHYAFEYRLLSLLVDIARNHLTNLQFASLFLQIGRQAEPSCYRTLFPLPESQSISLIGCETMDDLFCTSLEQGSYRLSITGLPLFSNQESAKEMCTLLFLHCLTVLHKSVSQSNFNRINNLREEKKVVSDVFSYALKLEQPLLDDESLDEEEGSGREYSILCGLPKFLGLVSRTSNGSRSKRATIVTENGQSNGFYGYHKALLRTTTILSRYLISVFVVREEELQSKHRQWILVGALSSLFVSNTTSSFQFCSKTEFSSLVEKSHDGKVLDGFDVELFFKQHILSCSEAIEPSIAGNVLDLLLLLLGCARENPTDEDLILVLLSIVVAHVAERIMEILTDEPANGPIWTSYFSARFELTAER